MAIDLRAADLAVILGNQHPSGALVASPSFPTYDYSWLRDGSFIAYGLDRAGEHAAAAAFHGWVARTVLAHQQRAASAIANASAGLSPAEGEHLHCRYTLDGQEAVAEWNNYQIDGYGAWLWEVREHLRRSGGAMPEQWRQAVQISADYVATLWTFPSTDCWEENMGIYPATLACLYGGMAAAAELLDNPAYAAVAAAIRRKVLAECVVGGRLVKRIGDQSVDASLLWVSTPFRLLEPQDPIMQATVHAVEAHCVDNAGGVHRFPGDSYYGGGAWILLTAWLGWYYRETGQTAAARSCLRWIEGRARPTGDLPEQVAEHLYDADRLPYWEKMWGSSACPLLWSHAMRLVLLAELEGA